MKKILFSILVSIFCSFFCLEQKTYIKCEAINDLETIGIYYEVERVDERTKVIVTGDDILIKKNLFTNAVYDMVSLDEYGIHKNEGNSIFEIFDYKYALMKINRNIVVTQEVRKEISDQFVDYIFGKIL